MYVLLNAVPRRAHEHAHGAFQVDPHFSHWHCAKRRDGHQPHHWKLRLAQRYQVSDVRICLVCVCTACTSYLVCVGYFLIRVHNTVAHGYVLAS